MLTSIVRLLTTSTACFTGQRGEGKGNYYAPCAGRHCSSWPGNRARLRSRSWGFPTGNPFWLPWLSTYWWSSAHETCVFLRQVSPGTDQAFATQPGAKHTALEVIAIVCIVVTTEMAGQVCCVCMYVHGYMCVGVLARVWWCKMFLSHQCMCGLSPLVGM